MAEINTITVILRQGALNQIIANAQWEKEWNDGDLLNALIGFLYELEDQDESITSRLKEYLEKK